MRAAPFRPAHGRRQGAAMLTVLLVLLALLVLCAPFLMTASNASRASNQAFDRAQARAALDSAGRYARGRLGASHPAVDPTPWHDAPEELSSLVDLDPRVLDHRDERGVMWDFQAESIAARIDLCSAPPQVFANLLGGATRLTQVGRKDDKELAVSSTYGFPEAGFLWVGRELIGYTKTSGQAFQGLVRGLGVELDGEGKPLPCGPQPASDLAPGTPVFDQRAWAVALWRSLDPDGELRTFDAPEQLHAAGALALAGLDADALRAFERHGSVYGGVRAGSRWQRSSRLVAPLVGGRDCLLRVDNWRWFNAGTTVQIVGEGGVREIGLVLEVGEGGIRLMQPVLYDHGAFRAEVRPLARRPVDVNAASREVLELLFTNLQLVGVNERITRDEAQALAALILESRPFTGLEDFVRRIVLPAAGLEALPGDAPVVPEVLARGSALIDARDAQALYANALNANDSRLLFSTLPLSFVSRDVYALELRASVNARSGVERTTRVREEIALVAPQMELLQAWRTQEDFDEALRSHREAPYWATGPESTSRHDAGATPPSRLWAHLGTYAGQPFLAGVTALPEGSDPSSPPQPEHVFASREDDGWAQLMASEVAEVAHVRGRVMHFRHETRDPEGRYLPEANVTLPTTDTLVRWSDATTRLMLPASFSLWIKPQDLADGVLLDVGTGLFEDADRLTLAFEESELVLRVYDGGGDRVDTVGYKEAGEARMAFVSESGPGMEPGTWSHVAIDVRGTRPDQITMLVDGRSSGVRVAGRTRLAAPLADGAAVIQIEDDYGFPANGVVRIGDELMEYVRTAPKTLSAARQTTGPLAGFGGRYARPRFSLDATGVEPGAPEALLGGGPQIKTNHSAGTPVFLYGYSLPVTSNVPPAASELEAPLGIWRLAVVDEVLTSASSSPSKGTPIVMQGNPPATLNFQIGRGIEAAGPEVTTGLVLRPADDVQGGVMDMSGFDPSGGYALLFQKPNTGATRTINGSPLLDMEIVRYSGYNGTTLLLDPNGRGVAGTGSQGVPAGWVPRAFVVEWEPGIPQLAAWNLQIDSKVFIAPISLRAPGSGGAMSFLPPVNGNSEFAQLTELAQAELTEWVRYDQLLNSHLVRNEISALRSMQAMVTLSDWVEPPFPPGGSPDPPPGFALAPPRSYEPLAPVQGTAGAMWLPYIGAPADANLPLTRAARVALQFRGVLGTYPQVHAGGTKILPVWRVRGGVASNTDIGLPGRMDQASLFDGNPEGLANPVRVHRAYRPNHIEIATWTYGGNQLTPAAGPIVATPATETGVDLNATYVALQEPFTGLVSPGTSGGGQPGTLEPRAIARLTLHPSGELPRVVDRVVVGGSLRGDPAPSAVVDELVFGSPEIGKGAQAGPMTLGGGFRLITDLGPGGTLVQFAPQALRVPFGMSRDSSMSLAMPPHRGLLRIGSEIVGYDHIDVEGGVLRIPSGSRALLGSVEEFHEAGETVTVLEDWVVGVLAASVGPDDSALPLLDTTGFPPQGTVLVNGELMHYTRIAGGALEMPRSSSIPGRMDGRGAGVFRGRFGTGASTHGAGAAVILYPFRYWDRWSDRFDGPELAYFGFELDQPGAWWRSAFFQAEEPSGGASVQVLQRVEPGPGRDAFWDADPGGDEWISLFESGMPKGQGNLIGRQSDRVQWRAFVRYPSGAYDAVGGLSHGWKQTPRLRLLGAEFLAPELVLRRVER